MYLLLLFDGIVAILKYWFGGCCGWNYWLLWCGIVGYCGMD